MSREKWDAPGAGSRLQTPTLDGDDAFSCTLTARKPSPAANEAASSPAAVNRPATQGTSRAERHTDLMSKRTVAIEKIANTMQDKEDVRARFCKAIAALMRMLSVQDQLRRLKQQLGVDFHDAQNHSCMPL